MEKESFSLIASNCLLGQFERERGLIEEAVVVASHRGNCSFFNKACFPRGWWQMERFPPFHLDHCWRVILEAIYSPIHLSSLVC